MSIAGERVWFQSLFKSARAHASYPVIPQRTLIVHSPTEPDYEIGETMMFELLLVSALDFYIGSAGLRAAAGILFAGTPFHPFVEGLLLSLESTPLVRQKVTPLAGATWVARDLLRELWVWASMEDELHILLAQEQLLLALRALLEERVVRRRNVYVGEGEREDDDGKDHGAIQHDGKSKVGTLTPGTDGALL